MNEEYKKLVRKILYDGRFQEGRNGQTMIIPHYSFTVEDMLNDHMLKLRKMYTTGITGEFMTLIDPRPLNNVKQFEKNGCNYWKFWAGEDGYLRLDYHDMLHPRLSQLISDIKKDPASRRHVLNLWNQDNVDNDVLSLACCWHNLTFSVIDNTLHLVWTQRSVDVMIGLPSDIYLAYLFMQHVASAAKLKVGSCMFSLSSVHIYTEHLTGAKKILNRTVDDYDKPIKFKLKV